MGIPGGRGSTVLSALSLWFGMGFVPWDAPQGCREWVDDGVHLIGGQGCVTFEGLPMDVGAGASG